MTKTTNDKTKSGGKNSAKSSKRGGYLFPKKVRTEISKFGEKLEARGKEDNSELSFVSTEVADRDKLYREILPRTYSIARLAVLISVKVNEVNDRVDEGGDARYGNELYWQWSECGFNWPQCRSWMNSFITYGRKDFSWEAAFTQLFADNKKDWNYLEDVIRSALDYAILGDGSPAEEKLNWVVRCLAIGMVSVCPTKIFNFGATLHKGQSRYWDKSNPSNPRLFVETRPFARFWALCSELFNYPWANPKVTSIPMMALELRESISQPTSKTKRDRSNEYDYSSQSTSARVDPKDGGFPSAPLKRVTENIGSNLSLASQEGKVSTSSKIRRSLVSPGDDDSSSAASGSDSDSNTYSEDSEKVEKKKSRRGSSSDESSDDDDDEDDASVEDEVEAASVHSGADKTGDANESQQAEEGGDNESLGSKEVLSNQLPSGNESSDIEVVAVVAKKQEKSKRKKSKKGAKSRSKSNGSTPPVQKIAVTNETKDSAVKQLKFATPPKGITARKKFISESEKVRTLHQIRMDGIQRKFSKIFCLSVSWFWAGDEAEEEGATVQDRGAQTITTLLAAMFEMFPNDFLLLPFSDYQFKLKSRWLKDKDTLAKITDFRRLTSYLDLKWNNGFTIGRSGQGEGNKILRTRIRVASNTPLDTIENVLHELFADTGFNMGIYASPLQMASALRIGWLLNYPIGIDLDELAREIMRIFKFEIPLALAPAFPINPSSTGKNYKRGTRQAIHIFAPANRASEVVRRLSMSFSKETPKHDMPFGAVTRFVYDWKAVRSKSIGVEPDPEISDFIVQMINSHENFGATTAVIRPNFPIRLLEQNYVELFEENITLLRLLYAILCTPRQAQLANENKDVDLGDPSTILNHPQDAAMGEAAQDSATDPSLSGDNSAPEQQPTGDDQSTLSANNQDSSPTPAATDPDKEGATDSTTAESTSASTSKNQEPTVVTAETEKGSSPEQTHEHQPEEEQKPEATTDSKSKLPDSTSQQVSSLTNTPMIIEASTDPPAETEEEKRVRLCKKDLENLTPAPLFLAALPSSTLGFVVLVVRGKNKQIAENVVTGFASFLAYHLELGYLDPKAWRKYLRVWLGRTHIQRTLDYGMVWDPSTLQAQSEFDKTRSMQVDEGNAWLDALDEQDTFQQQFDGTLTINLELASVRLMDDGTTVATRLREILRLKQIAVEHAEQQRELEQQNKAMLQQLQVNKAQADEINDLKAQLERKAALEEQHNTDKNALADSGGSSSGDDD